MRISTTLMDSGLFNNARIAQSTATLVVEVLVTPKPRVSHAINVLSLTENSIFGAGPAFNEAPVPSTMEGLSTMNSGIREIKAVALMGFTLPCVHVRGTGIEEIISTGMARGFANMNQGAAMAAVMAMASSMLRFFMDGSLLGDDASIRKPIETLLVRGSAATTYVPVTHTAVTMAVLLTEASFPGLNTSVSQVVVSSVMG